ncbi:methyltransferase domain-containing protein [Priestia megaterium]|uniref:methyltransferase domain-containing protein n=1 Tax=Priestia megaterium TaxID=1404 RepID=UPI002E215850|nr:methyltransferase domain-containing protein [Priestia megaterium]MED4051662.1 methyltransferase domain-containing protein [Priestia megaterium]
MITDKHFFNAVNNTNNVDFTGWDFSIITRTGRMDSDMLSWSYGSEAIRLIQNSNAALDMGTGGGEFLSLLQPFPRVMYATEGYKPNIPIAKKRLEPLGVKVVERTEDKNLPFKDDTFDLILNQHESFCASEVSRILSKEGTFFTQQVGGLDCSRINESIGVPINKEFCNWNLKKAIEELKQSSFNIISFKEEFPVQRFYDIGALVFYLKAIPWQVPNFDIETHIEGLYNIHGIIQSKGFFDVKQHRFIIKTKAK